MDRREFVRSSGAAGIFGLFVAAGLVSPGAAMAQSSGWNAAAFGTKTVDETYKVLGAQNVAVTKEVSWGSTPEIAENGAVVPVTLTSNLPKTESIAFLIEKNPNILAAQFDIPPGTDPSVSTSKLTLPPCRVSPTRSPYSQALDAADSTPKAFGCGPLKLSGIEMSTGSLRLSRAIIVHTPQIHCLFMDIFQIDLAHIFNRSTDRHQQSILCIAFFLCH